MSRYRPPTTPGSKYITPQGAKRLQDELDQLWHEERPRVTQAVSEAAAQGDRSENAEYTYGKKRLHEIDRRVRFLRKRLEGMTVVDPGRRRRDPRARVFRRVGAARRATRRAALAPASWARTNSTWRANTSAWTRRWARPAGQETGRRGHGRAARGHADLPSRRAVGYRSLMPLPALRLTRTFLNCQDRSCRGPRGTARRVGQRRPVGVLAHDRAQIGPADLQRR